MWTRVAAAGWLRSDVERVDGACVLAFWHHPLFSSGQHGASPQMRPAYRRLDRAGADVVLAGHEHDYERFLPQRAGGATSRRSPRAFVVGTGGAAHRPFAGVAPNSAVRASGTFGVLRLALRAGGYRWRFVPVAGGGFIDAGRGSC